MRLAFLPRKGLLAKTFDRRQTLDAGAYAYCHCPLVNRDYSIEPLDDG